MKAVILAGGHGTRLSEETSVRPKPMVEIGGNPLLWHIMKLYSHYGVNDFVVCLGYKGYVIKEYFANYFLHTSDVTIRLDSNEVEVHHRNAEPWRVTLVDTGADSMTGGRLGRVKTYVDGETFCMTYGDGVGNVPIDQLIAFHKGHGRAATLTATQPPGRFGRLGLDEQGTVSKFIEKPAGDGDWINGGFFVLDPVVFEYISDDSTVWEREPLERLAADGRLSAFRHHGFWQPVDTLRDKVYLEQLWLSKQAPWKVWR